MITSAALCPAPPLLARELTGADPVVPELRCACIDATQALLADEPELVVLVGAGPDTRAWPGGQLDLGAYAPALRAASAATPTLPLPLGLGAMLLDQAGYTGRRALQAVSDRESAEACAALGAELAITTARVALLVLGDGSARRGLKAPGYLDKRSAAFDDLVERAVRTGDLSSLLKVDPALARELMATGRVAWQVLAGAMTGARLMSEIRYWNDPFGVAYLVASLRPAA